MWAQVALDALEKLLFGDDFWMVLLGWVDGLGVNRRSHAPHVLFHCVGNCKSEKVEILNIHTTYFYIIRFVSTMAFPFLPQTADRLPQAYFLLTREGGRKLSNFGGPESLICPLTLHLKKNLD